MFHRKLHCTNLHLRYRFCARNISVCTWPESITQYAMPRPTATALFHQMFVTSPQPGWPYLLFHILSYHALPHDLCVNFIGELGILNGKYGLCVFNWGRYCTCWIGVSAMVMGVNASGQRRVEES